eukprot:CAMPEP_0174835510 /NCGR_PEP_ID=MMETSP1114-20130205/5443_1 /TAXON_ID=312471 /ORGANISM="Neobodo designis, Strain CCAP 1951/1" /LENGTH=589 /DNA_ID=CAMNT_0016069461 /DNA_START=191 /DNA_END=1960 /DNA_ORIENTATION=+
MPGGGGPLTYSYFRGFVAPGSDADNSAKFVVACDEKANRFFMAPKSTVTPTRMTRTIFSRPPTWALDLCPDGCGADGTSCAKGKSCYKLHASQPPVELKVDDDVPMLVCLKNGTSTHIAPSAMTMTAGLAFAATLKARGLVKDIYPWVCQRFLDGNCTRGAKCLSLHIAPGVVKDIPHPRNEAATLISAALQQSFPRSPGLKDFVETTLTRVGLRTVGDLSQLSNAVFEAVMHRDIETNPVNRAFWLLVIQLRSVGRSVPLKDALVLYPGVDAKSLDIVASLPYLATVNDLLMLRPKVLYSLPLRAQLLDACEKLRARYEDEREVYSQINLIDLPPKAFFRRMATLVCEFRGTHAHKSWRKQDATRPIVTSLITYVDPEDCHCSVDRASNTSMPSTVDLPGASPRRYPEHVPSYDHWCQCPRRHQLAVNYELSTPSGSRCSEQNALGALASMGLPTTCIREVFVHGGVHNSDDPNPLFPCGVCENMFRRVSKDTQKKHGGDVMLYMFDQETNPKKLVSIPVAEISHREGSSFRRFVTEDLREDAASAGMITPSHTFAEDPSGLQIPPMPVAGGSPLRGDDSSIAASPTP